MDRKLETHQQEATWEEPSVDPRDYRRHSLHRAHQKPGEDMYERLEVLVAELEAHKVRQQRLIRLVI